MHYRYEHADEMSEAERVASKSGVEIDREEDAIVKCPRCNMTNIPPEFEHCPKCGLKLRDVEHDWWTLFNKVAADDDPVREKFARIPTAIPVVYEVDPVELDHIRDVLLLADFITTYPEQRAKQQELPSPMDSVSQFDSEQEVEKAWEVLESIDEAHARKYYTDSTQYELGVIDVDVEGIREMAESIDSEGDD